METDLTEDDPDEQSTSEHPKRQRKKVWHSIDYELLSVTNLTVCFCPSVHPCITSVCLSVTLCCFSVSLSCQFVVVAGV